MARQARDAVQHKNKRAAKERRVAGGKHSKAMQRFAGWAANPSEIRVRRIEQFVTAITAKARHSGYTKGSTTERERPMIKIILSVVAALVVTVGALTITGAGDDRSGTPTMTTLPLQY
jgi:hypothetical protein